MIAIMSGSPAERLLKLKGRERKVAGGDIVFRSGDPVRSLFLVASGALRLTRTLPHGLQLTLQRAGPGAILAEASLFADEYHCDAVAVENSTLWVVPMTVIKAALREDF